MALFDGLSAGFFKRTKDGREVFFVRGRFGKGRLVPTEEDSAWLRRYLKTYNLALIVGIVPLVIVAGEPFEMRWLLTVLAYGLLAGVTWWPVRIRTRHWEVADERLTLREELTASAKASSPASLRFWAVISLLALAGSLVGFVYADDAPGIWTVALLVTFFGACFGVFIWMLVARRRA